MRERRSVDPVQAVPQLVRGLIFHSMLGAGADYLKEALSGADADAPGPRAGLSSPYLVGRYRLIVLAKVPRGTARRAVQAP